MRRTLAALAIALTLVPRLNAEDKPRLLFPWLQLFQLAGAPTAYREDDAHASGQYGNFVLAVRNDAGGTLCGTTGDYCAFQVDSTGQLRVVAAQAGAPWSVSGSGTFTIAGTVSQGNQGTHAQRWMVGLSDGSGFISPATDRTTAAAPFSFRLSDGSAFYDAAKTGQFPSALVSGRLDVNVGNTPTVTANIGTSGSLALDATLIGRLPAGASPADNESNTNTSLSRIGAFPFLYDGTTWDRWPGDSTNGAKVQVAAALPAGNNNIGDVDVVTLPANASVNLAQVGGTNTVTGGVAGSQAIGGTAGNNAAITQNPLVLALEARSSGPTVATNGNQIRSAGDLAGNQFNVYPLSWSCALDNIAATLTQCQAAAPAGFSYYITGVFANSTTSTAATFAIRSGTGSNCGTSTTGVLPGASTSRTYVLPANTAAPFLFTSTSGIKLTAAHAVCAIGAATNTLNITIMGYLAP